MADQPRYEPLEANPVYVNELMPRTPPESTVARGELQLDEHYFTGKAGGQFVSELPNRALEGRTLEEVLARGRERFTVFCSHCHGQVGGGIGGDPMYEELVGMVVARGYPSPPTFHQDRLRRAPIGQFFDVITNGLARMPAHDYLVPPDDRWAIAAYIRALQRSQYAPRPLLAPQDFEKLPPPDETAAATALAPPRREPTSRLTP